MADKKKSNKGAKLVAHYEAKLEEAKRKEQAAVWAVYRAYQETRKLRMQVSALQERHSQFIGTLLGENLSLRPLDLGTTPDHPMSIHSPAPPHRSRWNFKVRRHD